MLASSVMPSRTRHSSAQSDRSLIDHSGARNAVDALDTRGAQRRDALSHIRDERLRVELVHAGVQVPVRPDVMAGRANLSDQSRIALGDPAENEERGAGACAIELLEQRSRGEDDARGQGVPVLLRERTDATDVEPLLDVHRDRVRARPGPRRPGGPEVHAGFLVAVM